MLTDPDGQIVVGGYFDEPGTFRPIADIQRIDAADGAMPWHTASCILPPAGRSRGGPVRS